MKNQNNLFSDNESLQLQNDENTRLDSQTEANNREQIQDMEISPDDIAGMFNMSVNWTFEGLCTLVDNGSIDLMPSFQRGNVWEDERKSELIESIYLGLPIPPIILAELKPKSYVVVDGKQRLQTMIGFFKGNVQNEKKQLKYPFWDKPKLSSKLKIAKKLRGLSYEDLSAHDKRLLSNSVVSTWTLHNISTSGIKVLHQIFYRINANGVPLNLQELRQALFHGGFSNFLKDTILTLQPFQEVMGYQGSDGRMNDVEYLVRIIGNKFFKDKYKASLSDFLDLTMQELNKNWDKLERGVRNYYDKINIGIQFLEKIWGEKKNIGKLIGESSPFNKAYCEVQLYYFAELPELAITEANINLYRENLKHALKNKDFSDLFTRGTNGNYNKRFAEFKDIIDNSFKTN